MRLIREAILQEIRNRDSGVPLLVIPENPALLYDFANPACYPGTGTAVTDLSANGNDGTITGSGWSFANGEMRFTGGTGTYIEVPMNFDFTANDVTLFVFSKLDPASVPLYYNNIVGFNEVGVTSKNYLSFRVRSERYPYFYNGDGATNENLLMTSITPNFEYFFMAVRHYSASVSGTGESLMQIEFLNGLGGAYLTSDTTLRASQTARFLIGGDDVDGTYNGNVSFVALYNRALSETEINNVYLNVFLARH